jgi:hypothetical protein
MRDQRLIFSLRDTPGYMDGNHFSHGDLQHVPAGTVVLSLEGVPIGDESISHLPSLLRLRCLDLDSTKITDRALAALARLPQLEELWLEGTSVTDAGLRELHACKRLRFVSIAYTAVTEPAIRQLEAAVPGVEVAT